MPPATGPPPAKGGTESATVPRDALRTSRPWGGGPRGVPTPGGPGEPLTPMSHPTRTSPRCRQTWGSAPWARPTGAPAPRPPAAARWVGGILVPKAGGKGGGWRPPHPPTPLSPRPCSTARSTSGLRGAQGATPAAPLTPSPQIKLAEHPDRCPQFFRVFRGAAGGDGVGVGAAFSERRWVFTRPQKVRKPRPSPRARIRAEAEEGYRGAAGGFSWREGHREQLGCPRGAGVPSGGFGWFQRGLGAPRGAVQCP